MKSTEERYPELYEDNHLGPILRGFKDLLTSCDRKLLLDFSRGLIRMQKNDYENEIHKAITIIQIIGKDNQFARKYGIDLKGLKKSLDVTVKKYKSEIKTKRATPYYVIKIFHQFIFHNLKYLKWGQTKQINFMYDIYMECDFNRYRSRDEQNKNTKMEERVRKTLKDNIRKFQEEVIKQPHHIDYGK